ncbi:MAG TPA: NepR family anti-sigma factor [Acetobacteraceae bacterium]|nr:NepR family anti-sigma factor [Acetobacteraceae bacterium]
MEPDAAFDLWLERSLRALYDGVAKEPIPEDLLKLIEKDRKEG